MPLVDLKKRNHLRAAKPKPESYTDTWRANVGWAFGSRDQRVSNKLAADLQLAGAFL